MRKCLVVWVLLALAATSAAQAPRQVTHRYLVWGVFQQQVNFNAHWNASLDIQLRYEYTDGDWVTQLFRPSVSYVTERKFTFTAGFAYFRLFPNPNGKPARPEWRPWQEAGKKIKTSAGTFYPRVRFEERFIREYAGEELQEDFSYHSFRCRLRCDWSYPLGKTPGKGIYLAASNELFIAAKPGGFTAFDQNRAYTGAGYRFSPVFAVQLYYLNLFQQFSSTKYEMHHIVRLGFTCEITLPEKEEQPEK